jgi:secernin
MGANEHGVCAGNEAVCSRLIGECDDGAERLLGMDIVRLALERAATARAAVDIAAALLEAHGQGGGCAEGDAGWCYENGFLFADATEAWVLETAGVAWWAAERVPAGASRNISNGLSIRRPDILRPGLLEEASRRGWFTAAAAADFDWKAAMLAGRRELAAADLEPDGREAAGAEWLRRLAGPGRDAGAGAFGAADMARILRDADSGICMRGGGFASTGSQISVLPRAPPPADPAAAAAAVHLFTTGSDPALGCYKPFAFPPAGGAPNAAGGGDGGDADADAARRAERTRAAWRLHRAQQAGGGARSAAVRARADALRAMEAELVAAALAAAASGGGGAAAASGGGFDEAVEREIRILSG